MLKPNLMMAILAICAGLTACSDDKPKATVAPKATSTTTTTTTSTAATTTSPASSTTVTKTTSATATSASGVKGTADPYEGLPETQKY